ncbi:hypothetical protein ACFYZ9_18225 [Streptomyces sp. NPDC001691]|uniref:hypothetical protein n=1 Tax=unclassified Streptomyces TaxID=2593676 RepID=UPI000DEB5CFC|nr:hypothetical protein [Streptomyces sp. SDr-06]RCH67746.1 hypothetical protein DT019_15980 [Streptomyces sp. SDr-06]
MTEPPIVVHRPLARGGRRVYVLGQDTGIAYSDRHLIEFLRQSGIDATDAEAMVDGDSPEIAWQGAPAHEYGTY